jgi:hypothetical protein
VLDSTSRLLEAKKRDEPGAPGFLHFETPHWEIAITRMKATAPKNEIQKEYTGQILQFFAVDSLEYRCNVFRKSLGQNG